MVHFSQLCSHSAYNVTLFRASSVVQRWHWAVPFPSPQPTGFLNAQIFSVPSSPQHSCHSACVTDATWEVVSVFEFNTESLLCCTLQGGWGTPHLAADPCGQKKCPVPVTGRTLSLPPISPDCLATRVNPLPCPCVLGPALWRPVLFLVRVSCAGGRGFWNASTEPLHPLEAVSLCHRVIRGGWERISAHSPLLGFKITS